MNAEQSSSMATMLFLPYPGGGHFLPMVDLARLFASHGAKSIIVAPPSAGPLLRQSLLRDQGSGRDVSLHILDTPPDYTLLDASDMSAPPMLDTTVLRDPLRRLIAELRPDCLVADMFHPWAGDVADETGVPRILFSGNGCYARCAEDSIRRHAPHEAAGSDSEPFVLPGLPDRIEMRRSQLPMRVRNNTSNNPFGDRLARSFKGSFGALVNSFYELEPAYADYFRREVVTRAWLVGPVSLCNKNVEDKAERGGKNATIEAKDCINWLDSKAPNSVLYVSFGSLARLAPNQILEIAHGLEASNQPFVWALGKVLGSSEGGGEGRDEQNWLPEGFEKRVLESGKGFMVRGWAPQLLILEHPATGGFLTHCGWNSTTEAVAAGVPVVTWPLSADQFHNEKLVTEVLKIGVGVGSVEWASWNAERTMTVGRDRVAAAVTRVMAGGDEAAEMRARARALAEMARRAVEKGGSSYADAEALIEELKARRNTLLSPPE